MKSYYLFAILLSATACQNKGLYFKNIREGDLILQDLDCQLCEAIEDVSSINGERFSHIAIVVKKELNSATLIEAYPPKVQEIYFNDFIKRSSKITIARLKENFSFFIPRAIKNAKKLLGTPYDPVFLINNKKLYCAELIYEIFKTLKVFKLKPMTFSSRKRQTQQVWYNYYKKLSRNIPEGLPGINPNAISRAKVITVYKYLGNN